MSMYWAVFLAVPERRDVYEPLDFGVGEEPQPQLLLRRGRVALFSSPEQARDAIEHTIAVMRRDAGARWANPHRFSVIECRTPDEGHGR